MSVGMILLAIASVLVLFGVGQRVLDKMQLSDRAALILMAVIFFGGLLPDIRLGMVSVNIGGALAPVGVCVYLLIKADTKKEVARALIGSVVTAGAVYALSFLMPDEPEAIVIDPNYVYGLAGGAVAYILGRSRRAAFICGVLGVLLADALVAVMNWQKGINQMLHLGSGGAMDVVVISGLIAVLLSELVGELLERMARPGRENKDPVYTPVKEGKRK
ncbi:MAG: DUF1614 domain-containing protein [Clostridia bacterium]|nr:DUF1614 domain-containing protein [Clostridia bacterium]MBR2054857.1 DUF1614 domain-containing protein [Clostridia bacterium]MBR6753698.1 DUF1614 domain-containing protein [Clostridia bacterium]